MARVTVVPGEYVEGSSSRLFQWSDASRQPVQTYTGRISIQQLEVDDTTAVKGPHTVVDLHPEDPQGNSLVRLGGEVAQLRDGGWVVDAVRRALYDPEP